MHHSEQLRRYLAASPLLPAPMCGFSDRPFRSLMRENGANLVYTEMISSEAIVRGDPGTCDLMDMSGEAPPVVVQLFGSRAPILAEAACIVERMGAAVVDLNTGCPARKIVASNSGAALLCNPPHVRDICRAIRKVISVPFTVKTRWHREGRDTLEIARICEGEGVDAITLHARTPAQGYSGTAQWEWIARLKEAVTIPVVGNGDINSLDDIVRMRAETGCAAVMAGRGLVGNPWLMRDALEYSLSDGKYEARPPTTEDRLEVLFRHAELMRKYKGPHGLIEFRKHCVGYLHGLPGARPARAELMQATTLEEIKAILKNHFGPERNEQ